MNLRAAIVPVADREVGVAEDPAGSNCGPRVNQYKSATWLDASLAWPWCAAFIDWVVLEAMKLTGVGETLTFQRPRTAGAWDLENWSLNQDNSTWLKKPHRNDIQPGDLIIYKFSHCGIATSTPTASGYVHVIEGNTNSKGSREGGAVMEKKRHVSEIRSRIRFRV